MDEEEKAWMSDLDWDYAPVRRILVSFIQQKLLPGYVALVDHEAVAYIYFLVNQAKGIIGAIYAARRNNSQQAVDQLLSLSITSLRDAQSICRVEAQILPFHDLELTHAFIRHGFSHYPRHFMELDLTHTPRRPNQLLHQERIIPWNIACLSRLAEMTSASYRGQTDAVICQDYQSREGCESYLRSLVENPGCGFFLPEASFICLDEHGDPCGFITSSRISGSAAMIPQIAVRPSHQGKGIGNALMQSAFEGLLASGIRTVSLTVTAENRRAFQWYQRLGFLTRKQFGAFVWQRQPDI
jgi:ribosomal protein S18 acetylase RimI-like enzyme